MAKLGRKADYFVTSTDQTILRLIHQKDSRWRILATGQQFVASNEMHRHKLFIGSRTLGDNFWPWLRGLLMTREVRITGPGRSEPDFNK